jgi:hypothetical protein
MVRQKISVDCFVRQKNWSARRKKNRRRFQVGSREAVPSPPLAPELASWWRADLGLLSRTLLAADVLGPYPQRRHEDNTG